MLALAGPFLAGAALLVLAGLGKVRDPAPLVRALRSVGLRVPRPLVRVAAAAEVALGAAAAAHASRVAAALVALTYAGFALFVVVALQRGGVLASCGCFGRADTPPTRTHAVLTLALAAVAAAVAVRPLGGLPDVLTTTPAAGVPLLLASAALAAVIYVALAVLPLVSPAARVAR